MITIKRITFCVAIIFVVVLNSGCSMHVRQVAPDATFIRQIGVPVYPNATRLNGQALKMSIKLGDADELKVTLLTRDDVDRVQDFYAKHVPKNARKTTVPLGFTTATAFQWDVKNSQKEIIIERIKEMTIIELQSTTLSLPTSSQGATPIAQP